MIERQIKQLHEVGIRNITIAVGYLKEKFEYLIDKYGVELLYNPEYTSKKHPDHHLPGQEGAGGAQYVRPVIG